MFGFTALMCAASLPNGVGADVAKILLQRREVLVVHIYIFFRHINTNILTSINQLDLDWKDNEGRGAEDIARVSKSTRVVALIRLVTMLVSICETPVYILNSHGY